MRWCDGSFGLIGLHGMSLYRKERTLDGIGVMSVKAAADIPKFIEISLLSAQEGSRPRLQLMPRLIRQRRKSPFPSRTLFGNYGISFAGCRGAIITVRGELRRFSLRNPISDARFRQDDTRIIRFFLNLLP
jgi:hypothetical protein